MKLQRLLVIVFSLVLITSGTSYASIIKSANDRIQLHGYTKDGSSIVVSVSTKKYYPKFPYTKGFRWGVELQAPKSLVTSLSVEIGGKEIFVPLSVYADLTNPRELLLENAGSNILIIIYGGDAAASYKAVLKFTTERIQSKKVSSLEFPDESWEETVYSFNTTE